jgi:hypothetical protein
MILSPSANHDRAGDARLGCKKRDRLELFISGSLRSSFLRIMFWPRRSRSEVSGHGDALRGEGAGVVWVGNHFEHLTEGGLSRERMPDH